MHKMFTKKMAKRIAVVTLIYVVFCVALFWHYYPDPSEANLKVVEGIPTIFKSGSGRNSTSTIEIEGMRFSCNLSPIGPSVSCPTQLHQPGTRAQATFFYSRTIQDDLIGSRPNGSPILMRLKQSDFTVWAQINEQVFSKYEFGSILDFVVLALIPLIFSSIFLTFQKK